MVGQCHHLIKWRNWVEAVIDTRELLHVRESKQGFLLVESSGRPLRSPGVIRETVSILPTDVRPRGEVRLWE